jgi:hypothetical protein
MKLTYANVMSTIAVFLALGGTAIAGSRYIITSTNQIKPSVLSALHSPLGNLTFAEGPKRYAGQYTNVDSTATCPRGGVSIAGGYYSEGPPGSHVFIDAPNGLHAWGTDITNFDPQTAMVQAVVICAPAGRAVVASHGPADIASVIAAEKARLQVRR